MSRVTHVQLGESMLEVTYHDDGSASTRKLTEQEIIEVSLLDKDSNISAPIPLVENAIKEAYDDIVDLFKERIKEATLSAIGFSTSFSRLEIDHCNGRNSALIDICKEHLQAQLKEHCDDLCKLQLTDKEKQDIREAVRKEMKSLLNHYVYNNVRTKVKDSINKVIEEEVSSLTKQLKPEVSRLLTGVIVKEDIDE